MTIDLSCSMFLKSTIPHCNFFIIGLLRSTGGIGDCWRWPFFRVPSWPGQPHFWIHHSTTTTNSRFFFSGKPETSFIRASESEPFGCTILISKDVNGASLKKTDPSLYGQRLFTTGLHEIHTSLETVRPQFCFQKTLFFRLFALFLVVFLCVFCGFFWPVFPNDQTRGPIQNISEFSCHHVIDLYRTVQTRQKRWFIFWLNAIPGFQLRLSQVWRVAMLVSELEGEKLFSLHTLCLVP